MDRLVSAVSDLGTSLTRDRMISAAIFHHAQSNFRNSNCIHEISCSSELCFSYIRVIRLIYCSVWLLSPAKVEMASSLKDMKNTVEELTSLVQASSYKISLTSE